MMRMVRFCGKCHIKTTKKEGDGKIYEDSGKLLASVTWQDNKAISGKCANGGAFSSEDLAIIDKDSGSSIRPELLTPLFKVQEICE
ncbi:hypothetical protein [uncultured Campylobacter sp.]|uniref:hypothetical protein n=1 Tax=uncultured Campylobacter sp. TaxID=218934 RepID=UPI00260B6023|nr:hypothetical protein [uncultured Campylobacter sp.]